MNRYFNETKLYPQLSDIIFDYNNLLAFRENKKFLQDQFPRRVDKVNMEKLELMYEQMLADGEVMAELEEITTYAVKKIKLTIDNGTEIYEFVEKKTRIEPVGIVPLYKNEGYMLLSYGQYAEVRAYAYNITLFEHKNARYKGLHVAYIDTWSKSIANTYEQIKLEIIRNIPVLPNPAVYCIETELKIPFEETLLPIAKRMLVKQLTEAA